MFRHTAGLGTKRQVLKRHLPRILRPIATKVLIWRVRGDATLQLRRQPTHFRISGFEQDCRQSTAIPARRRNSPARNSPFADKCRIAVIFPLIDNAQVDWFSLRIHRASLGMFLWYPWFRCGTVPWHGRLILVHNRLVMRCPRRGVLRRYPRWPACEPIPPRYSSPSFPAEPQE